MSTAMKLAFEAANYVDPRETAFEAVIEVAIEAWRKWPSENAVGARRDHVRQRLRNDDTWIVQEKCQPAALAMTVTWLLNQAKERIDYYPQLKRDAGKPAGGAGQDDSDLRLDIARSVLPSRDAARAAGGGQNGNGIQVHNVPAAFSPDDAKPVVERRSGPAMGNATTLARSPAAPPPDRARARVAATLDIEKRLSRLDTVMIDGVAIGSRTVGEVRTWATRRATDAREAGRDARFALALIANLPSGELIRDWIKPDEADEAWKKAESEYVA